MQVILLEKITHLGDLGDIVKVKDGDGRDFLTPQSHAKRATTAAIAEVEARRALIQRQLLAVYRRLNPWHTGDKRSFKRCACTQGKFRHLLH